MKRWFKHPLDIQSNLGYPAISGPAHIWISDLAGYQRICLLNSKFSRVKYCLITYLLIATPICNVHESIIHVEWIDNKVSKTDISTTLYFVIEQDFSLK